MDLYREELLEAYKSTHNRGKLSDATHVLHEVNPLCGDSVDIYLKVSNGKVTDAKFEGQGCAISVAATSLFLDKITGMKIEDVKKIAKEDIINEINPELTISRIKCATLGYNGIIAKL